MKKRLIAIIMILAISISIFAGCGIIVKNQERDFAQIVAEVGYAEGHADYVKRQKNADGEYVAGKKQITKRDLVITFLNNGYNYMQQSGATAAEAVDYILNQLIWREIVIQEAIRVISKEMSVSGVPALEDCITADEKEEIERQAYDQEMADIIAEYNNIIGLKEKEEETEDEEEPDHTGHEHLDTSRVVQNKIAENEKPYESKYIKANEPTNDNWKAAVAKYNKTLDESEKGLNREKYFAKIVENLMEQKVLEKYQETVEDKALNDWLDEKGVNYLKDDLKASAYVAEVLQEKFAAEYATQKDQYQNNPNAFITALAGGSIANVLYIPDTLKDASGNTDYFYTKNLLIKFNDKLQKEVDDINAQAISDDLKREQKQAVFDKLMVEDLRSLFEMEEQTVVEESGKIIRREVPVATEFPTYMKNTGKEKVKDGYNSEDFYSKEFEEYLLKDAKVVNPDYMGADIQAKTFLPTFKNELLALSTNTDFVASEYYDKTKTPLENAFATLIFKYGNDPGMFNNEKDYLVQPRKAGTDNAYVLEYHLASEAGLAGYKNVINANGSNKLDAQKASLQITPSDFGYHIIMVTDIVKEKKLDSNAAEILLAFKNAEDGIITNYEKSFTYSYNKGIQDGVKANAYATEQTRIIRQFEAKDGFVVKYAKNYSDLLKIK